MAKKLFFVDSIYSHPENNVASVTFSHHGSITGHPDIILSCHVLGNTSLSCMRNDSLSWAVLKGRDGAFNGIYSPQIRNYFSDLRGCLVLTEIDSSGIPNKYVELDWDSTKVHYCQ